MIYRIENDNTITDRLPIVLYYIAANYPHESFVSSDNAIIYKWIYCVSGQAELYLDKQKSILNPGQAIFIKPNSAFTIRQISDKWLVHSIGFGGGACEDILNTLGMRDAGVYTIADTIFFPEHIKKLVQTYRIRKRGKEYDFSKLCFNFLLELSRKINRLTTNLAVPNNPIAIKVIDYLDNHYNETITLDSIADHLGLSKEYLCAIFKKETNQTIIHFLTDIRLSHACILLSQYPEKSVSEIGRLCGFDNPSYFGMIFKKTYGTSPEKYRGRM